jgi:hypothetical protein
MVVRIDKADRELRTDSSVIRHDPPIPMPMPCGDDPDPVRLFERSVISSIQNVIDFTINTRKHGEGRKQLATSHHDTFYFERLIRSIQ